MSSLKISFKINKSFKTFIFGIILLLIALLPLTISSANAEIVSTFKDGFFSEVGNFVKGILNDKGSGLYKWTWMIFSFLLFCIVVKILYDFVMGGSGGASTPLAVLNAFVWVTATYMIIKSYDGFTTGLWEVSEDLASSYQSYMVGNSDSLYMSYWFKKALSSVSTGSLSIFDDFRMIIIVGIWYLVSMILETIIYVGCVWAQWGYAVAKVTGMIFVPFLMAENTRSWFDGWFKWFSGFLILNVILRITMIVSGLAMKSVLAGNGVQFSGTGLGMAASAVYVVDVGIVSDLIMVSVIAFCFVISSFFTASSLAGSAGGASAGLGKVTSAASKVAMNAIKALL